MSRSSHDDLHWPLRRYLSKVPEVTVFFWIIKILATTVGETFADFLSTTLGLELTLTTVAMSALLAVALIAQFRAARYVPALYWLVVVLVGIVGTLITDNLVDNLGVSLTSVTVVFATLLATTFGLWYASEKTLSIHTVDTPRREAYYWLAILFTFALGTAAGDLAAEALRLGYSGAAVVFAVVIALVWLAHRFTGLGAIPAFWIAYLATRPLGACLGDRLSQPVASGGLGLGTVDISVLFLTMIVLTIAYLTVSHRDQPSLHTAATRTRTRSSW